MCTSLLDGEEHHTARKQISFLSFLIFFCVRARHLCVGVLSFFVGGICTSLWFFIFPSNLPGGSLFGAYFGGIGVGILLDTCDLSNYEGVGTSSVVCIRISLTSTK
jgi:hypothetical protein